MRIESLVRIQTRVRKIHACFAIAVLLLQIEAPQGLSDSRRKGKWAKCILKTGESGFLLSNL